MPIRTGQARNTFVAPRGSLESALVALWEDALTVKHSPQLHRELRDLLERHDPP